MARHVRYMGLASLIIVDNREEANYFIGHPVIDREFEVAGPIVNRLIMSGALRQFELDGKMLLSMRSRDDIERKRNQHQLQVKLDEFAESKAWDGAAFSVIVNYIMTGRGKSSANSALAYIMVCPFLETNEYDPKVFQRFFSLYQTISNARGFPGLLFSRLTSSDLRARRQLLELMNGNENGYHAVAVTLDNARVILGNLRSFVQDKGLNYVGRDRTFRWITIRTAPNMVLRQVKQDFSVPFLDRVIPKQSIILIRMKDSMGFDAQSGFEFASGKWSFCPAHKYVIKFFETLWFSLNETKKVEGMQ